MSGPIFNRVTERAKLPSRLWLVSAEWRGGHDRRLFLLENVFSSEAEAHAAWLALTSEAHNKAYGRAIDFDAGFKRHPVRTFMEVAK